MSNKTTQVTLLRDKGKFTKFQILIEVMRNQPHVKQKDIADKMGITVQAVSKYFKKLVKEGLLEFGSEKAYYRLTSKATAELHNELMNLENYVVSIKRELKIKRALPAIATQPVKAGEEVGIIFKEGVMYVLSPNDPAIEAKGITIENAQPGEDVGLKNLQGKIKRKQGKILIVKLPSIRKGGSRVVDLAKIKDFYNEFNPDRIGVMGAVGRAVLNKLNLKADIEFGISNSAAIAASRGLNVFVLVVGRMANLMIQEIDFLNMKNSTDVVYEVRDGRKT